jgi:hypothetical protein
LWDVDRHQSEVYEKTSDEPITVLEMVLTTLSHLQFYEAILTGEALRVPPPASHASLSADSNSDGTT